MAGVVQKSAETVVQFSQETPQSQTASGAGVSSSRLTSRTPWRSRRYTPYMKTPATRNLRSTRQAGGPTQSRRAQTRTPPGTQSSDVTSFRELINKTWCVHRVSPLYKFSHKITDMRQYSRVLSAHLEAEWTRGLAVATDTERANMAVFSLFKGLHKSNTEPEAVQIQLKKKPKRGGGDACVVATAVLCCVTSTDTHQRVASPFVLLPVMLFRGPVSLSKCLIQWLESQFDCSINRVVFSPVFMSWMVAMWAGSTLEKKGHCVQLQYKVPREVEGLDHITLDIDSHDCKALWDCIHTDETETFHKQEVTAFIQTLEAHFFHHFKVNISAMPLCQVGTAIAFIGTEGRFKIFSPEYTHQVLGHVTEMILESTSICT